MEGFVTACNRQIYYKMIGEMGNSNNLPLMVFLHEGLGCTAQWKDFPAQLAGVFGFPVLMYDRYGYGKSQEIKAERTPDYLGLEAMEFLPQILKQLGLEKKKLILFGHSDGGTIAAFFASFFPEKVLAAIIEAPHFFLDEISVTGIESAVVAYEKHYLKSKLHRFHKEKTESMFRTWTGVLLSDEMKKWNAEYLLRNIQCPVLGIQGTLDEYGTLEQIKTIQRNAKGHVELLVIEDCGHIPHHHAREQVFNATLAFLRKHLISNR